MADRDGAQLRGYIRRESVQRQGGYGWTQKWMDGAGIRISCAGEREYERDSVCMGATSRR